MTVGEVKQFFYNLVSEYHPAATVVWAKTKGVMPKPPFLSIAYGNMERTVFPMKDEKAESYYNCSMRFEINLYTIGKPLKDEKGMVYAYENTAVEDLEEWIRFLASEAIIDRMANAGITILLDSPIHDLSELIYDMKFNYRAMAEFIVTFVEKATGRYGLEGITILPNSSGGRTLEYIQAKTYEIKEIEIKEETYHE